jgi:ABC-type transport system involved in cytochrome bd biosynthesis fused ATPase/permease subunit/uncharacterized membrane protein YbaN (DUF454 family)
MAARGARVPGSQRETESRGRAAAPSSAVRTAKAANPHIFEAEDLYFAYTDRPVLRGVSFGIKRGAVTTLLGANACGKTTLLRLLCKDLRPSAGRVLLDGADIRGVRRRELAKRAAVVHQKTSAPDDLTVKQLTAYGRLAHRSMFRAGSAEDDEKIDRAMERAGVADLAETPVGALSGGQRQRAFIAMALAQDTKILILDEPTTFLDVRYRIEILELIRNLNEEHGVTVVMVLHDINEALLCSDEIIGLADGRVLVQGPPDEVIDPDSIRRLYDVRLDVREDAESGQKWVLPTCCGRRREPAKARKTGGTKAERADADGGNPTGTQADRARAGAHAFGGAKAERADALEFTADGADKGGLMKRIVKPLFIALGFVSLALGALGVVLPVLPTTPFLLLTAFCFARGSARFHRWFTGTKLYKNHIDDFVRTKSMTVKTKTSVLATVTVLLSLAIYLAPWPHARIAMGVVLAWHWQYFLLRVKTLRGGKAAGEETGGDPLPQTGARDAGENMRAQAAGASPARETKGAAGAAGPAREGPQDKGGSAMIDKRLLGFATGARKYIFLNVLARWFGLLCGAAIVFTSARFIEDLFGARLLPAGEFPPVVPVLCLCAGAALLRALCEFLAAKAAFLASAGVKKKLRQALYEKLLLLGESGGGMKGAEAVQVAVEGVDQIENYFGRYLPQFFYSMAAPVTLFVLLAPVNLPAAAILLVCTPLIPLLLLFIMRMARRMMRRQLSSYTSLGDFFLETLRGMTTLKIFGADGRRHEEMNALAETFRRSTMRVLRMQLNSIILMDVVAYGGAALGIILAVRGLLAGAFGLFGAVSFILLAAEFFVPLRQLGSYFHIAMNGLAACERVFKILDVPEPALGKSDLPCGGLSIEATALSFSYEAERAALFGLSFSVPAAGLTGIAGASGCGKSTLAKLLSGRLAGADYGGKVKIGGVELRDVDPANLRERLCLVTHEDYIFTGTVRDNLLMARPSAAVNSNRPDAGAFTAADAELLEALDRVRLRDFFAEQDGLDTRLFEGGANLSGGQKQRLSLARAILRNCDLYIFDEATSNIDPESESVVLEVMGALARSKNVLLISHRLANLTRADRILVLDKGRVAETGTHDELAAADGIYARMFAEQRALEAYAASEPSGQDRAAAKPFAKKANDDIENAEGEIQ